VRRIGDGGLAARVRAIARGLGVHRSRRPAGGRRTVVVGHRGAAREEAENTIPSFDRALELGANAVEADICVTRDGRFVVWHDPEPNERVALARQAGLEKLRYRPEVPDLGSTWRRPVRELTLDEFRGRHRYVTDDDGDPGGRGSGKRADPITLDDLLDWAAARERLTDLFLDVKLDERQTREAAGLVERVAAAASANGFPLPHLLSPCEPVVRSMARAAEPVSEEVRVSADFELPGADRIAPRTGAPDVSLGAGERFWAGFHGDVDACVRQRERGVFGTVTAWTINDARRLRRLVRDGVDAILTDDSALLRRIVEEERGTSPRSRRHSEEQSDEGSRSRRASDAEETGSRPAGDRIPRSRSG
jgi:glycerophosphoryl diester phosphodiesterase